MSYLYGKRFVGPITSLISQLRNEVHTQPYSQIKWSKTRHLCAKVISSCMTPPNIYLLNCKLKANIFTKKKKKNRNSIALVTTQ